MDPADDEPPAWKAHRRAEQALDRELDDAREGPKQPAPHGRHRIVVALPLVIVVAAIGGLVSYLIATVLTQMLVSAPTVYVVAGIVLAALGWGASGLGRFRATASDRLVDGAACALVGSLVIGILRPGSVWHLFDPGMRSQGLDGVPPFGEVFAWGAIATCITFAVASLLRLVIDRARA